MINLALLRLIGGVVAISAIIAGLFWIADAIGDAREAQVRAEYEAAIDDANDDTAKTNAAATKVAERDGRTRAKALEDAKAALAGKCPLTANEAVALSQVK